MEKMSLMGRIKMWKMMMMTDWIQKTTNVIVTMETTNVIATMTTDVIATMTTDVIATMTTDVIAMMTMDVIVTITMTDVVVRMGTMNVFVPMTILIEDRNTRFTGEEGERLYFVLYILQESDFILVVGFPSSFRLDKVTSTVDHPLGGTSLHITC